MRFSCLTNFYDSSFKKCTIKNENNLSRIELLRKFQNPICYPSPNFDRFSNMKTHD